MVAVTPVEVHVAGHTYRVQSSASEDELRRLADAVDQRVRMLTAPGRQISPNALVLVAMELVHELEEERAARQGLEARSKEALKKLLERIDAALEADAALPEEEVDDGPSPAPAPP